MKIGRVGCLGIVLLVVLAMSVLLNVVLIVTKAASIGSRFAADEPPKFDEAVIAEAKAVDGGKAPDTKIAVVHLRGIITAAEEGKLGETMVDDLKIQLEQAVADAKVKAIVLAIDSPGGEVTASDMIYTAVRRARDVGKKPVVVSMGSLAASGGFYVACAGSHLIANETTITGSIGVIMQGINYEQLFDKVGLRVTTFKSGAFKDVLSGARTMTEDEKRYIQGLVMQTYDRFVGIVATERDLPEDQLRKGIADGRVVSGKDAFAAKLVNQLGDVEDAYAKAMELGNAPGSKIVRYESGFDFGRLSQLLGRTARHTTKLEVSVAEVLTPKLEMGKLYYLPSYYAP